MFSCLCGRLTRLVARLTVAAIAQRITGFQVAPGDAVEVASPGETGNRLGGEMPRRSPNRERASRLVRALPTHAASKSWLLCLSLKLRIAKERHHTLSTCRSRGRSAHRPLATGEVATRPQKWYNQHTVVGLC